MLQLRIWLRPDANRGDFFAGDDTLKECQICGEVALFIYLGRKFCHRADR